MTPEEMTPEEALQILDQAASLASLNRQSHFAIQQAAGVLVKYLAEQREPAKAETPPAEAPGGAEAAPDKN